MDVDLYDPASGSRKARTEVCVATQGIDRSGCEVFHFCGKCDDVNACEVRESDLEDRCRAVIRSDVRKTSILVDHGCEGAIIVNGEKVSLAVADKANFDKFCKLKGKVKSVTLLSCSTGHGDPGCEFLKKVSECLGGVSVTGYSGDVKSWNRKGKRVWGSWGTAVTKAAPVPTEEASWGQLKELYR